jgi:ABC-type multidrug transport system fused ATPase/permease subunit
MTQATQGKRLTSAWSEARALVVEHRARLALGLALLLVNRAAGLVLPSTSKVLIDDVIGAGRVGWLGWIAAAAGLATLLQASTSFALSQVLGVAAQKVINEMRKQVQAHVARLPVAYFDSTQSGVLISRIMNDAEGVRNLVGTGLVQLVGGSLTACVGVGVLFWLSWKLTLWILLALCLFGGAMAYAFNRLRPLFRERGKIQADVTGRLGQSLGGIRVVKAYVAEESERRLFATGVDRLFANVRQAVTGVSALTAVSTVVVGAVGVVLILLGGREILAERMSLGDFVMYLVFVGVVVGPVVQISSIGTQISEAFAGLDRIRELRAVAAEDEGDEARARLERFEGRVTFEQVSFAYAEGRDVLHDVSFDAAPGSTTALVGSSGSGKSTLIGLVMAFQRPRAGRVLVDGRDLAGIRLADYRAHLGVVLQDNFLFDGTIEENIRFSRPDASEAEVLAAARTAHCDAFVREFAQGYRTVVGERGVKLSGGQRQRVAIARALLARPRLLILDEATSSLDSESEAMIQDGLAALRRSCTTFVIAHRLSTIRSADQILVLEGGRIVERGTHAELYAAGGRYRELHDRQHRFELERFVNPGEEIAAE